MSIRKTLPLLAMMVAAADPTYYHNMASGYTQCTGRGNESKPISAGKNKKRPFGQKKLTKKQRRK